MLVLDEPTANLDYGNKLRVLRELERLRGEGRTILFSTHDPDHALAHADRALLLADGRMLALAAVADALTDETLSALYGVPVRGHRGRPACAACSRSRVEDDAAGGARRRSRRGAAACSRNSVLRANASSACIGGSK